MHAAASITDSLPPSALVRGTAQVLAHAYPRRRPQSGHSAKSKAWPALSPCASTPCLPVCVSAPHLPACLLACLPACSAASCCDVRLLCSPAARPRSPQERRASLIAVLADEASGRSGSHYSHPTLPRPTLPDQIYRGSSCEEYNSFISPLHLHPHTARRIAARD
jgi:hypothetical protein